MVANKYTVYEQSVRHEMLQFIPENAQRILDVGCSVGNFGALLKHEQGAEVWGVEIDKDAAEIASQKLDKVYTGEFDHNLEIRSNYFDCVVFNDVLEHMVDPYSALSYAKELLAPNGKVVASIPNVRYFGNIWLLMVHKSWEYVDAGILDRTHLRFFTEKSIRQMFEEKGFEIERIEGINCVHEIEKHFSNKYRILNLISFRQIRDMRWLQFAVVAVPSATKSDA